MRKTPMVSVVMITYNHEKYIEEAIEGVLMQQCKFDVEFIIANDKSTDQTHDVVQKILHNGIPEHIKVRYYNHETNKGMVANFIWALQQAQGKYIALCEGDDFWTDPIKLQKQMEFLESNKEFVLCCHNASMINSEGELLKAKVIKNLTQDQIYQSSELKKGAWLLTLTLFYRNIQEVHDTIYNVRTNILNSDMLLFSILGKYGKGKYLENIKPAKYRVHEGGVWSSEKQNKTSVTWHRYELEKILKSIHSDDQEVKDFFGKRLMDLHRKLHRNLDELEPSQILLLNKEFFKRNGFSLYRTKEFIKNNLKLLKAK